MATRRRTVPAVSKTFLGLPVDPHRSAVMSRIRGKNTAPELALRKALRNHGVRYRLHTLLPGRPDLANRRAKVAVFVDGCFWHGCPKHFRPPRTRTSFWTDKIARNQARRRTVLAQYAGDWTVFQVYECELKSDLPAFADKVATAIQLGNAA